MVIQSLTELLNHAGQGDLMLPALLLRLPFLNLMPYALDKLRVA